MFGKNLDVLLRGLVGSSESPGLSPTERILCVLLDIDVVLRVFEEYAFFFDMCQTWGTENDVLGRAGEQARRCGHSLCASVGQGTACRPEAALLPGLCLSPPSLDSLAPPESELEGRGDWFSPTLQGAGHRGPGRPGRLSCVYF